MTRLSRDEQRLRDEQSRRVITLRPGTIVGGFPWLALAPLLAAAATPVASSVGKWVGKKVFGEGLQGPMGTLSRATGTGLRPAGAGIQRAGERPTSIVPRPMPAPIILARALGSGSQTQAVYRAGDYPMPTLVSIGHHKGPLRGPGANSAQSQPSDTRGIGGGIVSDVIEVIKNPKAAVMTRAREAGSSVKKAICKRVCKGGACKGGAKGSSASRACGAGSSIMKAKMAALRAMKKKV